MFAATSTKTTIHALLLCGLVLRLSSGVHASESASSGIADIPRDASSNPWALGLQVLVETSQPQTRQILSQSDELHSAVELFGMAVVDEAAASNYNHNNLRKRALSVAYEGLAIRSIVPSNDCNPMETTSYNMNDPTAPYDCFHVVVQVALQLQQEPNTDAVCRRLEVGASQVAQSRDASISKLVQHDRSRMKIVPDDPMIAFCLPPDQAESWQLHEGSTTRQKPSSNANDQTEAANNIIVPIVIASVVVVLLVACVCIVDRFVLRHVDTGIVGRGDVDNFVDEPKATKKKYQRAVKDPRAPQASIGDTVRQLSNRALGDLGGKRTLPARAGNFSDVSSNTNATASTRATNKTARSTRGKDSLGGGSSHSRPGLTRLNSGNNLGGMSSHARRNADKMGGSSVHGRTTRSGNDKMGGSSVHGRNTRSGNDKLGGSSVHGRTTRIGGKSVARKSSGGASVVSTRSNKTYSTSRSTGTKKSSRASSTKKASLASMDV